MSTSRILRDVADYYSDKIRQHGASPAGVDWRDTASQRLRFAQLMRVTSTSDASVVDLGCGYGALLEHLRATGHIGLYHGIDISSEMIAAARIVHASDHLAHFSVGTRPEVSGDFALASGIFNVRLGCTDAEWRDHMEATITLLDQAGTSGFAFNCLTSYSDADRMRPDLYYADPTYFFNLCKQRYSRNVALLHDYDLYEFTILVRKQK